MIRPTKLLMLDSGAFTVWAAGAFSKKSAGEKNKQDHVIDLGDYIRFCAAHPGVSYYVNLDVIPGRPRDKRSLTPVSIDKAAREGYANYQNMCKELPREKVIPVFHQGDPPHWLSTYMRESEYVGISPANDQTVSGKLRWMKEIRPMLFDAKGDPMVKTHGFAVTTYKLMKYWDWYSVDSASWKLWAGWGIIYVPQRTGGGFDYSKQPHILAVSPCSKKVSVYQEHYQSASPTFKRYVQEYLETLDLGMGSYRIKCVDSEYKLPKVEEPGEGEIWYKKKEGKVLVPIEAGISTSFKRRCIANARFVWRSEKVLPVRHIYYAGAPMPYDLEYNLGKRLLSYHEIGHKRGNKPSPCLDRHLEVMDEYQRSRRETV